MKYLPLEIKNNTILIKIEDVELNNILQSWTTLFPKLVNQTYVFGLINKHTVPLKEDELETIRREYGDIKIKITLSETTPIQQIGPKLEKRVIMFDAVVIFVDEPKTYTYSATVKCDATKDCRTGSGVHTFSADENHKFDIPNECLHCGTKNSVYVDEKTRKNEWIQTIMLEEIPDNIKNNSPKRFTAKITGNLVGDVYIGDRKRFVGVPKSVVDDNQEEFKFFIDVISAINIEEEKPPELTLDELDKFQKKALEEGWLEYLCESFAPHIKHRNLEKLAIILSTGSGLSNFDLRSRSHLIIFGGPGMGKSELAKFIKKIILKGDIIDGTAVSQSGLVFGLDKLSNGQNVPTAGFVILNNNGVCIFDEFDKAGKKERKSLHSVLEQGIARYDKIKHMKNPTIITMIAFCNPKYLEWNEELGLGNIEHIERTILDRCDVKMRMKPVEGIIEHKKQFESYLDGISHIEQNTELLTTDQWRGLLFHIMKIQPKITPEAKNKLLDFYGDMKKLEKKDSIPRMDQRQAEGLVRLCVSMARWFFKTEVDCMVVDKIIDFYKRTLETLDIPTDAGIQQIPMQSFQMNREEAFWECVKQVEKDEKGYFDASAVLKLMLQSPHWKDNPDDADKYFYELMWDKLKRIHMRGGRYKKV